jgi:hypothetical protein
VLSLLKAETTAAEAARRHGLKVAEVEEWRDRFLLGAENALRARPREEEALREEELNRLKRKVGELTMDLDILRTASRLRPMTPGRQQSDKHWGEVLVAVANRKLDLAGVADYGLAAVAVAVSARFLFSGAAKMVIRLPIE